MNGSKTTVVFLDIDVISADTLDYVSSHIASSDIKFIRKKDAVVEDQCMRMDYLESYRSYKIVRADLALFLEDIFSVVLMKNREHATYRGHELFSVFYYELIFAYEKYFYPVWVLSQLLKKFKNHQIKYFCHPNRHEIYDYTSLHKMVKNIDQIDIIFDKSTFHPNRSFWKEVYGIQIRLIRRSVGSFFRYFSMESRKPIKTYYRAVFVENYDNSAKISASISRSINHSGFASTIIATRKKVSDSIQKISSEILMVDHIIGLWAPIVYLKSLAKWFRINKVIGKINMDSTDYNLFDKYLMDGLQRKLSEPIFNSMFYLQTTKKILDRAIIDLLCSTSYSGTFSRAFCLEFQKRGVPTYYFQHGMLVRAPVLKNMLYDNLIVWSSGFKDMMTDIGIKSKKIIIASRPYGSRIKKSTNSFTRSRCKVMFFASRIGGIIVTEDIFLATLSSIVRALSSISGTTLTIKLHPADYHRAEKVNEIVNSEDNIQVETNIASSDLINEADICLVASSTVGLEVCEYEKALVYLNFFSNEDLVDYKRYDAAHIVSNESELTKVLESILELPYEQRNTKIEGQRRLSEHLLNSTSKTSGIQLVSDILMKEKMNKSICHE